MWAVVKQCHSEIRNAAVCKKKESGEEMLWRLGGFDNASSWTILTNEGRNPKRQKLEPQQPPGGGKTQPPNKGVEKGGGKAGKNGDDNTKGNGGLKGGKNNDGGKKGAGKGSGWIDWSSEMSVIQQKRIAREASRPSEEECIAVMARISEVSTGEAAKKLEEEMTQTTEGADKWYGCLREKAICRNCLLRVGQIHNHMTNMCKQEFILPCVRCSVGDNKICHSFVNCPKMAHKGKGKGKA